MRLTVDLDAPSELRLVSTQALMVSLAERFGGEASMRVSSGGLGYHFKVHGCPPYDAELRALYGDDAQRVYFDCEGSAKPKQVLYSRRDNRVAEEWDNIYLSLPWWGSPPRRRMR